MFDDDLSWEKEEIVLVDSLGMTPRQSNMMRIEAIAKLYDYTVEDVLGKSKLKALVAVRRKCVVMLRDRGHSTTEIGRIMRRDHSTICHALKKYEQEEIKALARYELEGWPHDTIKA
jgi:chromosomal replication initiation ATPase DnaA